MAYLFFKNGESQVFRLAKDDSEKTKILNFCQGENLIEKTITEEEFLRCDYESHRYTLVDGNVVETETTEGSAADDPLEVVPPRKSEFKNAGEVTQAIEAAVGRINQYLNNNEDATWQAYRDALASHTPSTNSADYPKEGSLSKIMADEGISAYNVLRLP